MKKARLCLNRPQTVLKNKKRNKKKSESKSTMDMMRMNSSVQFGGNDMGAILDQVGQRLGLSARVSLCTMLVINATTFNTTRDLPTGFDDVVSGGFHVISSNLSKPVVREVGPYGNLTNVTQIPRIGVCFFDAYESWLTKLNFGFCIFCFVVIVIGNTLVILLPIIEKKFRLPVFITLLSFSVISIMFGATLLIRSILSCKIFPNPIFSAIDSFISKVYILHLCVLASQRILITIFPLKSLVYHTKKNIKYVLIFVYSVSFIFELFTNIFVYSKYYGDIDMEFSVLGGVTCAFLIFATIASAVKSFASKNIQAGNPRRQSVMASVVIVIYVLLDYPFDFVLFMVQRSCSALIFIETVTHLNRLNKLIILSINPIILCLRIKEARKALLSVLCARCKE